MIIYLQDINIWTFYSYWNSISNLEMTVYIAKSGNKLPTIRPALTCETPLVNDRSILTFQV